MMQNEQDIGRDSVGARTSARKSQAIADRAAALFRPRERRMQPTLLPLSAAERGHYAAADFAYDASGVECFRGLSHAESLDYIALQRTGLDNDDDAFLRLIQLGDRHASAMRIADGR